MIDQIVHFFNRLFETEGFPARWHCGSGWDAFTGWFYICSNLMIWSAYFAIPTIIITYVSKRKDVRFSRVYILFASFILACGATHLIDALLFWIPVYRISAVLLFLTGCISWMTVAQLIKLMPVAFSLKSAEALEQEVQQRKTAETKLRMSIRQLNDAQKLARFGHWHWDLKTDEVTWSEGVFRIYGLPDKYPINYDEIIQFTHPDDREYVQKTVQACIAEQRNWEYYHRILTSDGQERTIHALGNIGLADDGSVAALFGTVQDVTEQKRVEQELHYKTQTLEAANRELEKFASVASHDLREPLRKIMTFATMLEQRATLEPATASLTHKIVGAAGRMQQLIDDVLSYSKLDSRVLDVTTVDLNKVFTEVIQDLEIGIRQQQAIIDLSPLPQIEGNKTQLRQLAQNLLSNAIKFSRPGVPARVTVRGALLANNQEQNGTPERENYEVIGNPKFWEHDPFVQIEIADNGIGFDEVYLDKIFVIFQRLHGQSDYEGTGIGLAICKKVVEAHHGQISARSEPGVGSTFTILLPVSQKKYWPASPSGV